MEFSELKGGDLFFLKNYPTDEAFVRLAIDAFKNRLPAISELPYNSVNLGNGVLYRISPDEKVILVDDEWS
jgi:hypothetical protein